MQAPWHRPQCDPDILPGVNFFVACFQQVCEHAAGVAKFDVGQTGYNVYQTYDAMEAKAMA